jgi:hypothetical protein
MRMNCRAIRTFGIAATVIAASTATVSAQGWQPTEEVEIVTHVGNTSSTWANADEVAKASSAISCGNMIFRSRRSFSALFSADGWKGPSASQCR